MTYVDDRYISVARKNEVQHHEHTIEKLRAKIAQLTKAVAWELEQHHSRLNELKQVEDTLTMEHSPTPAIHPQPTFEEPVPSIKRRTVKTRKAAHSSNQEPVAALVG